MGNEREGVIMTRPKQPKLVFVLSRFDKIHYDVIAARRRRVEEEGVYRKAEAKACEEENSMVRLSSSFLNLFEMMYLLRLVC